MKKTLVSLALVSALIVAAVVGSGFGVVPLNSAGLTQTLDGYVVSVGYTSAVTASATIKATIEALAGVTTFTYPSDTCAVELVNLSSAQDMYVQFDATAADTEAFLLKAGSGMTIVGSATVLADVRIYAASSCAVGFLVYVVE